MRNIPPIVWLLGAGVVGYFVFRKRIQAALEAPARAGEAISSSIFDALHPSLSKEEFNKPTIVPPDGSGKCPSGYKYKVGLKGPYCLRQ